MASWIEGTISLLQCEEQGHSTPHLTLSGNTDMVTNGIASLSSVIADEIVVANLSASEIEDRAGQNFEARINSLLHRDDLRFVQLRRVEEITLPAGLTFQAYRKAFVPPRLVFACPRCGADAIAVRTESPTEYKRNGGTLTVMADLELCG